MSDKKLTIIKLPPQDRDVYFVIRDEMSKYMLNEHRCPSDLFLQGCEQIITDGDTDPHGLFEFVRVIDEPEFIERGHDPHKEWSAVLPEAFENQS